MKNKKILETLEDENNKIIPDGNKIYDVCDVETGEKLFSEKRDTIVELLKNELTEEDVYKLLNGKYRFVGKYKLSKRCFKESIFHKIRSQYNRNVESIKKGRKNNQRKKNKKMSYIDKKKMKSVLNPR